MEIKGSAVKSISDYIKKFHSDKYDMWYNALPDESKKIFGNAVLSSEWYNIYDAAIVPTGLLGNVIFNDPVKGAWECGRFSAETALTGIYKFFIKAASPFFIIERAGKIFSTFYQPSVMQVSEKGEDYVVLQITQFAEPHIVLESRICGWIEKAMEIHGVGFVDVIIRKSMTKGDSLTEFLVKWGDKRKN